ncbi:MAG TPA: hypothetical protein VFW98_05295 [Gemmatimonadaceae bacterium]|nr:hypothetical protein [Gemmatimonadaceae bacterium]
MVSFAGRRSALRSITAMFAALAVAACGGHNHLERYSFADRSLAVVYYAPAAPELETGLYNVSHIHTAVDAVLRAGSGVAKEIEGGKARARLDSAATQVDVATRMSQRTLDRVSRYLGTHPVTDRSAADYLLEVNVRDIGIDARGQSAAYLYMNADAVLLDRHTGHEIWDQEVQGTDRLTPFVRGTEHVPTGIITAGALSTVSVADFQQILQQLSDYSADLIINRLRDALWDVRKDQPAQ